MKKIILFLFLSICIMTNADWKTLQNKKSDSKHMICDMNEKGVILVGKIRYYDMILYDMGIVFYENLENFSSRVYFEIGDKVFAIDGIHVFGTELISITLDPKSDAELLQEMKKGNKMIISIYNLADGRKIEKTVTLKGFTKAFNNIGR